MDHQMDQHQTHKEEAPTKPLALTTHHHTSSPSIYPVTVTGDTPETAPGWRSSQYLRRRRCMIYCCGCCAIVTVILGILILILSLTVFKIKDPSLNLNYVDISDFNTDLRTNNMSVSSNVTLTANIALKNPNIVSFKFKNSTTDFYYEGKTVGVAYAPSGELKAYKTMIMNVSLDVLTDQAMQVVPINITGLIFGEDLNFTSYTEIVGRVNVLGIYKRNIDITLNCSYTVEYSVDRFDATYTNCLADTA